MQSELLLNAKAILSEGGIDHLLIELCAGHSSELTRTVPHRSAAIRITERMDLRNKLIVRVLRDIILRATRLKIKVTT